MADSGSSSNGNTRQETQYIHGIPQTDFQVMAKLYQICPKLRGIFENIVRAVQLMAAKTEADEELHQSLSKVNDSLQTHSQHNEDIMLFLSASGFVEKCVSFARQMLRTKGVYYFIDLPSLIESGSADVDAQCLNLVIDSILRCTTFSSKFSLRLTETGFLHDLVDVLNHLQHLTAEALEEGDAFLFSMGTIHNCCMYPETAAAVKQLDIVPPLKVFLAKRGRSHFARSVATAVLANVLEEKEELDLLTLDADLLQYFLDNIQTNLSDDGKRSSAWVMNEILFNLTLLARNHANKRLMVAQGILGILCSVLEPSKKRSADEKKNAVALISRLIEDQVNLQICQNYHELSEALNILSQNGADDISAGKARDVLAKLKCCQQTADPDDRIASFPLLVELLADQANILGILNLSLVEFVLEELKVFTEERGNKASAVRGNRDASCRQVLSALAELAAHDEHQREIMSRGGLAMLRSVLHRASCSEDQEEAARVILKLSAVPENRSLLKIDADLTTLLADLEQRADNKELAQLAENIRLALSQ